MIWNVFESLIAMLYLVQHTPFSFTSSRVCLSGGWSVSDFYGCTTSFRQARASTTLLICAGAGTRPQNCHMTIQLHYSWTSRPFLLLEATTSRRLPVFTWRCSILISLPPTPKFYDFISFNVPHSFIPNNVFVPLPNSEIVAVKYPTVPYFVASQFLVSRWPVGQHLALRGRLLLTLLFSLPASPSSSQY